MYNLDPSFLKNKKSLHILVEYSFLQKMMLYFFTDITHKDVFFSF
jgi:hypothetical protein